MNNFNVMIHEVKFPVTVSSMSALFAAKLFKCFVLYVCHIKKLLLSKTFWKRLRLCSQSKTVMRTQMWTESKMWPKRQVSSLLKTFSQSPNSSSPTMKSKKSKKQAQTLGKGVDKVKLPDKHQNNHIGPVIQVRKTSKGDLEYNILNKPDKKSAQSCNKLAKGNINHCTSTARPTFKTTIKLPQNMIEENNIDEWKCFICKRKPDELSMGDLFGPYAFVNEIFLLFQTDSSITSTSNLKEIWLHEDCVVWLPNVLLFHDYLLNFDSAMKELILVECVHCLKPLAAIRCIECHRNCSDSALHFPCARKLNYHFDESTFTVYCRKHHKALKKG